jgi:hypothetical protein
MNLLPVPGQGKRRLTGCLHLYSRFAALLCPWHRLSLWHLLLLWRQLHRKHCPSRTWALLALLSCSSVSIPYFLFLGLCRRPYSLHPYDHSISISLALFIVVHLTIIPLPLPKIRKNTQITRHPEGRRVIIGLFITLLAEYSLPL